MSEDREMFLIFIRPLNRMEVTYMVTGSAAARPERPELLGREEMGGLVFSACGFCGKPSAGKMHHEPAAFFSYLACFDNR